jgi:hypothetical protein
MNRAAIQTIRDAQGRLHKRDESLTIVNRLPHADFDTRPLLKARFEDGSTGVVFSEEVQLLSAECMPGNKTNGERTRSCCTHSRRFLLRASSAG